MVIAMLLAHLVGDFILQWDGLARWKSESYQGVLVHCLVVSGVTLAFGLITDPSWWPWLIFIVIGHLAIDSFGYFKRPAIQPMLWFMLDQTAHMFVIFFALIAGGLLTPTGIHQQLALLFQHEYWMIMALGYAFLTMPAWVTLKFFTYGIIDGSPPKFIDCSNKYIGMFERLLIATLVLSGQFLLIPFVTIPRLVMEWPQVQQQKTYPIYMFELMASMVLATGIGFALRLLSF